MMKSVLPVTVIGASLLAGLAPPATAAPTAEVEKVWTPFDVEHAGRKGLLVHSHLTLAGAKGKTIMVQAFFYYEDGTPLKAADKQCRAPDGQVTVGDSETVKYDPADFPDYVLFLPYDALNMAAGEHELSYRVQVFDGSNMLAESQGASFHFSQGGPGDSVADLTQALASSPGLAGSHADAVLRRDLAGTIVQVFGLRGCEIAIVAARVSQKPDAATGTWVETWDFQVCGEPKRMLATLTPTPDGGTDFSTQFADER